MKIDNSLAEVFDIDVIEKSPLPIIPSNVEDADSGQREKIETDYNKVRSNLSGLLETGQEALYTMIEIARNSESGKDYAIVGNMLKQLSEINAQLMANHERKQKLDQTTIQKADPTGTGVTNTTINNNAVFVGSTSELSKMIKNMNLVK